MNRTEMLAALVARLMAETDLSREDATAQIDEVTANETDEQIAARLA